MFSNPKTENTEHELKIFHLIVYNFYLIIPYVQSDIHTHLEALELGFCSTCQTGEKKPHLQVTSTDTIKIYSEDRPGGVYRLHLEQTTDALL